ncbi:hypothetical protein KC866_00195 [Patescibacteria group bacterium]|nr:hypothetical protein [Patescibacteria group bacterium]
MTSKTSKTQRNNGAFGIGVCLGSSIAMSGHDTSAMKQDTGDIDTSLVDSDLLDNQHIEYIFDEYVDEYKEDPLDEWGPVEEA